MKPLESYHKDTGQVFDYSPTELQIFLHKNKIMEEDKKEAAEGRGVTFQMVSDIHLEFKGVLRSMPKIPVAAPILCLLGTISIHLSLC